MGDNFRSINVDVWEEDILLESDLVPAYHLDPASAQQQAESTSSQVRSLLNKFVHPAECVPHLSRMRLALTLSSPFPPPPPSLLFSSTRSDPNSALQLLLDSPPYGGPEQDPAKETTLATLLAVLNGVKSADIASILKSLDLNQKDTLMKWIYKGLARPELGSGGVLLGWHEKVRQKSCGCLRLSSVEFGADIRFSTIPIPQLTEVAGTGCIVRVMTDRRRV